jgi:hypothetical protein
MRIVVDRRGRTWGFEEVRDPGPVGYPPAGLPGSIHPSTLLDRLRPTPPMTTRVVAVSGERMVTFDAPPDWRTLTDEQLIAAAGLSR